MYKIIKRELVDTISIPIMSISKNVILSHKVKLSKPDMDGNRDYYHKEFTYRSKYKEPSKVTTLRLTHSSILVIENKNTDDFESLIINTTNRDFVVKSLSLMKKIMKKEDLFVEHDDKFIVNPKLRKESVVVFEPYRNKAVTLKPCVIEYGEEGTKEYVEGIAMNLNSKSLSNIEVPLDIFNVMIKNIKKFDFHIAGLAAVIYLQCAEIGNHEIDIVRTSLSDFDTDLEPVYKPKKENQDKQMDKLQKSKSSDSSPMKNKGW